MSIERPLDFLNNKKGKDILLQLKDSNGVIKGKLITFDIHLNLVLEIKSIQKFFKGDSVLWIE